MIYKMTHAQQLEERDNGKRTHISANVFGVLVTYDASDFFFKYKHTKKRILMKHLLTHRKCH